MSMFEGFAKVWTAVIPARRLGAKPLRTTRASEPYSAGNTRRITERPGAGRVQ